MGLLSLALPQTERVVFLIDLQPLSHLPDRGLYVSAVLKSVDRFTSHPPLSDSLFAFRLFSSSLNPLFPTTQLERLLGCSFSPNISFERPSDIARSVESVLASVASRPLSASRAAFVAGSLQQLLLHYAWETVLPDLQGTSDTASSYFGFSPNLILLFTTAPRTRELLCGYLGVEMGSRSDSDRLLSSQFIEAFGGVRDKFRAVGANVCWLDVGIRGEGENGERDGKMLGALEEGIKGLGWGFVSCDSIILGSLVVPFGLIWPIVACPTGFGCRHLTTAEFNLEITDSNGNPLNCRLCDLEVVDLRLNTGNVDFSLIRRSPESESKNHNLHDFWKRFVNLGVKIHVDGVRTIAQLSAMRLKMGKLAWLCGFSGKGEDVCKRKRSQGKSGSTGSVADAVLERLRWKESEFTAGKPAWQLLLTFLYMRSSVAIVSIFDDNGCSITGILEPFTVHTAILRILDDRVLDGCSQEWLGGISISSHKSGGATDAFCNKGSRGFKERAKRKDASSSSVTDLTWDALYTSVLCSSSEAEDSIGSAMELQSLCLHRGCNMSKRLTFLKCWMKQMRKSKEHHKAKPGKRELKMDMEDRMEDMLLSSQQSFQSITNFVQESQQFSSSCQSAGENLNYEDTKHEPPASHLEDLDAFFSSIRQKIGHGLCNVEVDLACLAERLVHLSFKHVQAKHDSCGTYDKSTSSNCDSHGSQIACTTPVLSDVAKILLRKPKELAAKYKGLCLSSTTEPSNSNLIPDPISVAGSPEMKVREHELQVLFRMEILKATVEVGSKAEIEDKWVKEICFMLQNIEFDLPGGIFGGVTLLEFTERALKSRYTNTLGGVIHKIYTEMEFLSFDTVASGLDDCDSDQAANDITNPRSYISRATHADENIETMHDNDCTSRSLHHFEEEGSVAEERQTELYEKQLNIARKNREQAQKFSFFNKRLPDLQRLWTPKHPWKVSRRVGTKRYRKKCSKKASEIEIVYETPDLAIKRSRRMHQSRCSESGASSSCRSVSKALFPSFESIEVPNESGSKS